MKNLRRDLDSSWSNALTKVRSHEANWRERKSSGSLAETSKKTSSSARDQYREELESRLGGGGKENWCD